MITHSSRESDDSKLHINTTEKERLAQLRNEFVLYRRFYLEAVAKGWSFSVAHTRFLERILDNRTKRTNLK